MTPKRTTTTKTGSPARRRVWYSVAMSLDGYIARADGGYDWIPNEPEIDWGAFMGRFDTVLMGRRTYQVAQGQRPAGAKSPKTYVFSRTLRQADHPDVTIVSHDPAGTVNELRRQPGKDIWLMGGGVLFRNLLGVDAVDMVEIGLVPALLGGGIPLLPAGGGTVRLSLVETRRYSRSGILALTYEVARAVT